MVVVTAGVVLVRQHCFAPDFVILKVLLSEQRLILISFDEAARQVVVVLLRVVVVTVSTP